MFVHGDEKLRDDVFLAQAGAACSTLALFTAMRLLLDGEFDEARQIIDKHGAAVGDEARELEAVARGIADLRNAHSEAHAKFSRGGQTAQRLAGEAGMFTSLADHLAATRERWDRASE